MMRRYLKRDYRPTTMMVLCATVANERYLLMTVSKRNKDVPFRFGFPQGGIKKHGFPFTCGIRELIEEVDVNINGKYLILYGGKPFSIRKVPLKRKEWHKGKVYIPIIYLVSFRNLPALRPKVAELSAAIWCKEADYPQKKLLAICAGIESEKYRAYREILTRLNWHA